MGLDDMITNFDAIRDVMAELSRYNSLDLKSFLMMMKSLYPNSTNLMLFEYEVAKDCGDVNLASQIFCQLHMSSDNCSTQLRALLNGVLLRPPDAVCCDIFCRLTFSVQRDVINYYFSNFDDDIRKADDMIYLLNIKSIQCQPQVASLLFDLAYKCLRVYESHLSAINATVGIHESKLSSVAKSPESGLRFIENNAEGEEGEVVEFDEDEELLDDDDPDELGVTLQNNVVPTLNVCKFKVAYEIFPLVHKLSSLIKLDRNFVNEVSMTTLNFLFSYLTSITEDPTILGLGQSLNSLVEIKPSDYLFECLRMLEDLMQWSTLPSSLWTKLPDEKSIVQTVKLIKDLIEECKQLHLTSLSECLPRSTKRKHRPSKSKLLDIDRANAKCYSTFLKTLALFWSVFIELGLRYLHKVRSGIFNNSLDKSKVSYCPINLNSLILSHSGNASELDIPEIMETKLLTHLNELWDIRKHNKEPHNFGCKSLDIVDSQIRPHHKSILPYSRQTIFETLIIADLITSGLNTDFREISWISDVLNKIQDNTFDDQQNTPNLCYYSSFSSWILTLMSANSSTTCNSHQISFDFKKIGESIAKFKQMMLPDMEQTLQFSTFCTLVPVTSCSTVLIAAKTLAHYLCNSAQQDRSAISLDAACIACVLCQIDGITSSASALSTFWPSPYPSIANLLQLKWPEARQKFAVWFESPHAFIFDPGLLSMLAELEYGYCSGKSSNHEHESFLSCCHDHVKMKPKTSCYNVIATFIKLEADRILACLTSEGK